MKWQDYFIGSDYFLSPRRKSLDATAKPGYSFVPMEEAHCILCGPAKRRVVFTKSSADGEAFTLVRCAFCGLRFLSPRPTEKEIGQYYRSAYFTRRTDRGYDNYFAPGTRAQIERLFLLNLGDLGFSEHERSLRGARRALDIGCAAGYFVNMLAARGWNASGIDISESCVAFARDRLKLDVTRCDYLEKKYRDRFDLITLWATIEHLHRPDLFLQKIHRDLGDGGRLYLSTCRAGGASFMRLFGSSWRYYNFPEHLYFFSIGQMRRLLTVNGFRFVACSTYGSGFGRPGSPLRKAADFAAKRFNMGDMMVVAAEKA
ncbi:MAG TPA: class I SAM-dependent methyltransferase [Spirochaetota bacterium]|nr:class I SAM-dependent methyltransferase [Spirochaetota bacterium]